MYDPLVMAMLHSFKDLLNAVAAGKEWGGGRHRGGEEGDIGEGRREK